MLMERVAEAEEVEALVGQFVSNAVQQSLVGRGVSVKVTFHQQWRASQVNVTGAYL
jgi:hypothetical protein